MKVKLLLWIVYSGFVYIKDIEKVYRSKIIKNMKSKSNKPCGIVTLVLKSQLLWRLKVLV